MFCPQCGTTTEAHLKYCKACGFRLVDFGLQPAITAPLTPAEAKSQLRRLKGTRTLVASLVFWLPTLFTMMIAASTNGPDQEIASIIAFFFVLLSFGSSGWGLFNLWRGGFFKHYKEQRIRAEAALLTPTYEAPKAQPGRAIAAPPIPVQAVPVTQPTQATPALFDGSVIDHTTRELRKQQGHSEKNV